MRVVQKALTFDDVLLIPAHSAVLPREVSLKTKLTRGITLNIPLLAAAMDTVTESRLAIAIAQEGGIGIVHKNMTPKAQAIEVTKVKRFESGIVKYPITITQDMTVRDVLALTQLHRISGLPVVGADGKVVGIVTNRDLRFESKLNQPVKNIMTPRSRLVTVREGSGREEARALMHKHRLERVLVVNKNFELRGLITVKDILKSSEHPNACKDKLGRLRVGAAIGVGEGTEERAEALVEAGVDVIIVDTAHGHSEGVLKRVRWLKRTYPKLQVIAQASGEVRNSILYATLLIILVFLPLLSHFPTFLSTAQSVQFASVAFGGAPLGHAERWLGGESALGQDLLAQAQAVWRFLIKSLGHLGGSTHLAQTLHDNGAVHVALSHHHGVL